MSQIKYNRRKHRTRKKIRRASNARPRLSVHRSSKHIYAQIIDDQAGTTICAASTMDQDLGSKLQTGGTVAAAGNVGKLVAERAIARGINEVVFDRGGFRYHGRVKALADGAREGGLAF